MVLRGLNIILDNKWIIFMVREEIDFKEFMKIKVFVKIRVYK